MKILITGAAGFIGSHLVRTILGPDQPLGGDVRVTVLDKLTYAGRLENLAPVQDAPGYAFVHGDITDAALVDRLVAEHDAVIHLAAESHVDRSIEAAQDFVNTNVLGTSVLLDAALRHGTAPFVHVSTDEVYGSVPVGSSTEDDLLRPNSPYSASKASSDLIALAYHRTHGLDVRVTRCSNNYGPYQYPEKVIPLFVTRLLRGENVPLYGDGGNVRDWLHVDDHCRGLLAVLTGGRAGEIYNIGGGTELTNKRLTALLLETCGADWDRVDLVADRKGHDRRYSVDWTKIRDELGYRPVHDFMLGITETVDWYRKNHKVWTPLRQGPQTT
ncbi:dTDP-glucose 4,6-dehydratase [Streptantibioticus ferralitis]|uniref:dTDP-glucose 4,6-dehydratase n=1 Tax=Streptantibioticus ferralitis TaxID=236510 RepID=A0ABT5YV58_9ACTN|nr:dTDP-glucose 4,6-dehydratase [Streptantibioticus ferralitis]MDF2255471.1 dTDP-glucose 4,6-dehydratase [Streptantibioticus ferralitis]